jgi:hypothetical protein
LGRGNEWCRERGCRDGLNELASGSDHPAIEYTPNFGQHPAKRGAGRRKIGVERDTFGDSTGTIAGV